MDANIYYNMTFATNLSKSTLFLLYFNLSHTF